MAAPRHDPPVVTAMTTPLLVPAAPSKQVVKTVPAMPEPARPRRSKTRR